MECHQPLQPIKPTEEPVLIDVIEYEQSDHAVEPENQVPDQPVVKQNASAFPEPVDEGNDTARTAIINRDEPESLGWKIQKAWAFSKISNENVSVKVSWKPTVHPVDTVNTGTLTVAYNGRNYFYRRLEPFGNDNVMVRVIWPKEWIQTRDINDGTARQKIERWCKSPRGIRPRKTRTLDLADDNATVRF